ATATLTFWMGDRRSSSRTSAGERAGPVMAGTPPWHQDMPRGRPAGWSLAAEVDVVERRSEEQEEPAERPPVARAPEPGLLPLSDLELDRLAEERVVRPEAVRAGLHFTRGRFSEEEGRPSLGVEGEDDLAVLHVVRTVAAHGQAGAGGHPRHHGLK